MLQPLGKKFLIVSGKGKRFVSGLQAQLGQQHACFSIEGEPTVDEVARGTRVFHEAGCDAVVAIGGGSAIDAGKAIAVLARNEGDIRLYLEVIGEAQPLRRPGAPCAAIPTTAGAGAEATRNAVLHAVAERVKVSVRGPFVLPTLAIVDPALVEGLPFEIARNTSLDALTQLIEPFVSARANPFVDGICRQGLAMAARAIRPFLQARNGEAREQMAFAALSGGMALANAGLGAVHGFAAPIGGMFGAPHGAICAALLPHVMEANCAALESYGAGANSLARYDEIGRLLTGSASADRSEAISWVRQLCAELGAPRLGALGISKEELPQLVDRARQASSMKANPVKLTETDLVCILEKAL